MADRCYRCFRPASLCYCHTLPTIDNATPVLILQHLGERDHPFNTARMVQHSLRQCEVVTGYPAAIASKPLPLLPGAGLLYPKPGARLLPELAAADMPTQLVVIDGTWGQAKSLYRDVPQLHDLPCYVLAPEKPGEFRIRREPDDQSLSTVEAVCASLSHIAPATGGLPDLLDAFRTMNDRQLETAGSHDSWRRKKAAAGSACPLPRALQKPAAKIVVAYGEATPEQNRGESPRPLNWFAQRLTGDRFAATLRPPARLTSAAMSHMRLTEVDIAGAVDDETFRQQWQRFSQRDDTLVAYHPRTLCLLQSVCGATGKAVAVKSIPGIWPHRFTSLEELLAFESIGQPSPALTPRATHRLQMAVTLVEHLRGKYLV